MNTRFIIHSGSKGLVLDVAGVTGDFSIPRMGEDVSIPGEDGVYGVRSVTYEYAIDEKQSSVLIIVYVE